MKTKTSFSQLYSFPGFRARARFKGGVLGDPGARVVCLVRRQKKRCVQPVGRPPAAFTITGSTGYGIWTPGRCGSIWSLNTGAWTAAGAKP